MEGLPAGLTKRIADELARVGEWGRVVLHIANGRVSRIEGTRSTLVVDEALQRPLSEVRRG